MAETTFIDEVYSQGPSLQHLIEIFDFKGLEELQELIQAGHFDRVILTGMGASTYSTYPAWLILSRSGLPVIWVDTSELIHYSSTLITSRTLLWVVSQSGQSAEIIALMNLIEKNSVGAVLATVSDFDSPLANKAKTMGPPSAILPIVAEAEQTMSTRTYVNSLAVTQLAAIGLCGENLGDHISDLTYTLKGIETYLADWENEYEKLVQVVNFPSSIVLIGRGCSMASVWSGGLFLQEGAKVPALAFQAGQFRHGPLELADSNLTVICFAGSTETIDLNYSLFKELIRSGVNALWVGGDEKYHGGANHISLPRHRGIGLPLAEILPIQLLVVYFARQKGIIPGQFKYMDKVTRKE